MLAFAKYNCATDLGRISIPRRRSRQLIASVIMHRQNFLGCGEMNVCCLMSMDWTGYHMQALGRLQLVYSPDVLQALQLIIHLDFGAVDWLIAPPRQFIFTHVY